MKIISTLAEKYNLPESTINKLIQDGILGCSVAKNETVINEYNRCINKGIPHVQAIANAAEVGKISERQVYRILDRMK